MRYNYVLFDADETLFDYPAGRVIAVDSTLRAFGLPHGEEEQALFVECNNRVWRMFDVGAITPERLSIQRFEDFLERMGREGDAIEMSKTFEREMGKQAQLLPDALEVVSELYELGVRFGLVTNGLKAVQRGRLSLSPITRYFDSIMISQEQGVSKPDPEMYHRAMRELGASSENTLMVGDSLATDIKGGVAAGLDTCYIPYGDLKTLEGVTPTHTVNKLRELIDIVTGV